MEFSFWTSESFSDSTVIAIPISPFRGKIIALTAVGAPFRIAWWLNDSNATKLFDVKGDANFGRAPTAFSGYIPLPINASVPHGLRAEIRNEAGDTVKARGVFGSAVGDGFSRPWKTDLGIDGVSGYDFISPDFDGTPPTIEADDTVYQEAPDLAGARGVWVPQESDCGGRVLLKAPGWARYIAAVRAAAEASTLNIEFGC